MKVEEKVNRILEVSKRILEKSNVIKYNNIKEERMLIFAIAKIVSENWSEEDEKG